MMVANTRSAFKLFYCYAREDKDILEKLEIHLSVLKRQNFIKTYCDLQDSPGIEREKAIETHLNTADIILLLISSDFMASEYCYEREMKVALERHDNGDARVIPILIRSVCLEYAPFTKLQMLPTDHPPISEWTNVDAALTHVVRGIDQAIKDMLNSKGNEKFTRIKPHEIKKIAKAKFKRIQISPSLFFTVYTLNPSLCMSTRRYAA